MFFSLVWYLQVLEQPGLNGQVWLKFLFTGQKNKKELIVIIQDKVKGIQKIATRFIQILAMSIFINTKNKSN